MRNEEIKNAIHMHSIWLRGHYGGVRANLSRADLIDADLSGADLSGANLDGAVLRGAVLRGAVLRGANLTGANLTDADLDGADLDGASLPPFVICPTEGEFVAWKYADGAILKLLVPAEAVRTCSLVSRKCRATHVRVLDAHPKKNVYRTRNGAEYRVGEETWADSWNDDPRVDSTSGIHFLMTKEEAERFGGIS